jgi:hypothetical protein
LVEAAVVRKRWAGRVRGAGRVSAWVDRSIAPPNPEGEQVKARRVCTIIWIVVNSSMRAKIEYLAPVQEVSSISGQIRVTFRTDGTLRLAYDDFTVSGSSDVFLERGSFKTDYSETWTSVTDAVGEDTYELAATGDFVFYGELFEENILEGTETVRSTATGLFLGIESGDYELEVEIPESTEEEYPAGGWAFIGAANQVRFACGGEILLLDDVVLRRAG